MSEQKPDPQKPDDKPDDDKRDDDKRDDEPAPTSHETSGQFPADEVEDQNREQ